MSRRFTAVITREDDWLVAYCIELGVASQGKTVEEAQANLKEAVELYLESFGEDDIPDTSGEIVLQEEGLCCPARPRVWENSVLPRK